MSDALQRAARALTAAPIDHGAAAITRVRVLARTSEAHTRRSWLQRWALLLGMSVCGSTALAAWTPLWQQARVAIADLAGRMREPSNASRRAPAAMANRRATAPVSMASARTPALAAAEDPATGAAPAVEAPVEPVAGAASTEPMRATRLRPRTKRSIERDPAEVVAHEAAVVAEPPRMPEHDAADVAAFRRAHQLYFVARDEPTALTAFERYLSDFPQGRFRLEAEYNRALVLLSTGQRDQAAAALAPFAAGTHGSYRRREAEALIKQTQARDTD